MVFTFVRTKTAKKHQLIDAEEAFNIWAMLKSDYHRSEVLNIWHHFTHDADLKLILATYLHELQQNISDLEKILIKYSIKCPSQNRTFFNSPANPEVFQDEYIANEAFIYIQEQVENLLKTFRTTMTNDSVRNFFKKRANNTINNQDKIVQYLKLKGWLETPPLYQDIPKNINERLTTVEAYNLWDHLTYRYDNLRQTQIFTSFAFDGDFKIILKLGVAQLTKHAGILEKKLEYFGIPLPKKPPAFTIPPDNTEILDDDYMYRTILQGIQGASVLHAQALKQCTFNDHIRSLFKNLLFDEIELLDKFIKFGKAKAWLNPVPAYKV